jgi:feruloyl esterase
MAVYVDEARYHFGRMVAAADARGQLSLHRPRSGHGRPSFVVFHCCLISLEEFKSYGGKLILTHGFADPLVPTLNTVSYYERLITGQTDDGRQDEGERKESLRRTREFARLFLLPGVAHCGGGAGPDTVEGDQIPPGPNSTTIARLALDPLRRWVEHGIAPDQIIAYKVTGGVTDFSRPICPYPALPRYKGVGDPTKASSFACADDGDHDDNQPPAPKYLNDGDNYPILPIDDSDRNRGHDHDYR